MNIVKIEKAPEFYKGSYMITANVELEDMLLETICYILLESGEIDLKTPVGCLEGFLGKKLYDLALPQLKSLRKTELLEELAKLEV